jgi:hypothetical protein
MRHIVYKVETEVETDVGLPRFLIFQAYWRMARRRRKLLPLRKPSPFACSPIALKNRKNPPKP